MIYYKVKDECDNIPKRTRNSDIYIGGELYTYFEVKKQNLNMNYLEKINIPAGSVTRFFGARFQT